MRQPSATAARSASSTARAFGTGSTPGRPRSTSVVAVLGGAPNVLGALLNSLPSVRSCTCTSSPITASQADSPAIAGDLTARAAGMQSADRQADAERRAALFAGLELERAELLLGHDPPGRGETFV